MLGALTAGRKGVLAGASRPRDHGRHLRTTRVVESPVAAVRGRTTAATRCTQVAAATAMLGKVLRLAAPTLRRRKAPQ